MEDNWSHFKEAECALFKIRINQKQFNLCVLYHCQEGNALTFFELFLSTLEIIDASSGNFIINADFKVRGDVSNNSDTINYKIFWNTLTYKTNQSIAGELFQMTFCISL